ncbi:MAG: YggT family protein [Candidatus Susulua stagnicola]|nr:YggT family protein [Candidatus Susulua stagnicola]
MFIISNFLFALARVLDFILNAFTWLIIIRALISWVNPDPYNTIVQLLHKLTEPIFYPIRKLLPFSFKAGIDLSPIIAILIIVFCRSFLVQTLFDLALKMR